MSIRISPPDFYEPLQHSLRDYHLCFQLVAKKSEIKQQTNKDISKQTFETRLIHLVNYYIMSIKSKNVERNSSAYEK